MPNELFVYDVIGEGFFEAGVTAKGVRDELAKFDKKRPISVHVNSPGGDVFEGVAIRTQLAEWKAGVNVFVDGLAASAASYIATVGDTVTMAAGSMLMIHDPWSFVVGNSAEMLKASETLDKIADNLVAAYVAKSGQSAESVREAMRAETWYTADEAVAFGLADAEEKELKAAAFAIPEAFGYKAPPIPTQKPKPRPHNSVAALQRQLDIANSY